MATPQMLPQIFQALTEKDPKTKVALTQNLPQTLPDFEPFNHQDRRTHEEFYDIQRIPGLPDGLELVKPGKVKRRGLGSQAGRASFIHAIAHIEFNAINLALDAVWRFENMPPQFYRDWLQVAAEEATHFSMLSDRLKDMGYNYGDFPAHNGLWGMAEQTGHDVMIRMALVPRVLEARGLDITPAMIDKLKKVKDHKTIAILDIILHDEIDHVRIGSHWFHHCCAERNLDPIPTFLALVKQHMTSPPKSPFNEEARGQAGFSQEEITELVEMEQRWLKEIKK